MKTQQYTEFLANTKIQNYNVEPSTNLVETNDDTPVESSSTKTEEKKYFSSLLSSTMGDSDFAAFFDPNAVQPLHH
jgi:hypothetical protein